MSTHNLLAAEVNEQAEDLDGGYCYYADLAEGLGKDSDCSSDAVATLVEQVDHEAHTLPDAADCQTEVACYDPHTGSDSAAVGGATAVAVASHTELLEGELADASWGQDHLKMAEEASALASEAEEEHTGCCNRHCMEGLRSAIEVVLLASCCVPHLRLLDFATVLPDKIAAGVEDDADPGRSLRKHRI